VSEWGGVVVATCTAFAMLVSGVPTWVTRIVGRRAPEAVASRLVGWRIVSGAIALGLVVIAIRFWHSGVRLAVLGSWLAVEAIRHVPVGRLLALVLPGLTDPSLLGV
jgi:hypothetical protein